MCGKWKAVDRRAAAWMTQAGMALTGMVAAELAATGEQIVL